MNANKYNQLQNINISGDKIIVNIHIYTKKLKLVKDEII